MGFYISPDKVPWATNSLPWGIRNYRPWNFTMISTIAHDGIFAGNYRNFPGQLGVAHWAITKSLNLGRLLSTPWDTERGFTV